MQFKNGEILVSPSIIYWAKMPMNIGENDQIELLKNDILLVNCDYGVEDLRKFIANDNKYTGYFYNLDGILTKSRIKTEHTLLVCEKIAQFIAGYCPNKSVIHTYTIDKKICELFRSKGLIYIEKNLFDKTNAVTTLLTLVRPLFSEDNQVKRTFLRINLYPDTKYKVEITNSKEQGPMVHGYLKDLSLNGLGLLLNDQSQLMYFKLKDVLQIKIFTQTSVLKIPIAYVTRKDDEKCEIGVNYNINDKQMIKEETANYLTKLIYNWIREIINEFGKIEP